jgi:hypothetical protein
MLRCFICYFMCGLFDDAASSQAYTRGVLKFLVNNELERV